MGRIARRLLLVLERELDLVGYLNQNTCWHYDDKIAQAYLLKAAGIPMPETWVFFNSQEAKTWAEQANYPLVLKLSAGEGSSNVRLIENIAQAHYWIDLLFKWRFTILDEKQLKVNLIRRIKESAKIVIYGDRPGLFDNGLELQSGYVIFQEYLPDNNYDTRVTIIGNRAFAFRRYNRKNDFRASGSGNILFQPDQSDLEFVALAFNVAKKLNTTSCAVDGLYKLDEHLIVEISYTYASWAVHNCPGHWILDGDSVCGNLIWVEGQMKPEKAQVEVFLSDLENKYGK